MAHKTYIRHTDGDLAVLFLHGFLGSPEHFEPLVKEIPEGIGIYNLLLAGHGKTVRDFGKASMQQWKQQVEDVMKELEQRYRKVIIVGHSMGTFFAMEQAVKRPELVESLLLLQTPLKIFVKPISVINTLKSFFSLFGEDEVGRAYRNAHSVKLNFKLWEYITWIPRYSELFRASAEHRKTVTRVTVPCYIFQSKRDEMVSLKSLQFVPEQENFHIHVLEQSAHFIYDVQEMKSIQECFCKLIKQRL